MRHIAVRELMIPLKAYATISEDGTLFEAMRALAQA